MAKRKRQTNSGQRLARTLGNKRKFNKGNAVKKIVAAQVNRMSQRLNRGRSQSRGRSPRGRSNSRPRSRKSVMPVPTNYVRRFKQTNKEHKFVKFIGTVGKITADPDGGSNKILARIPINPLSLLTLTDPLSARQTGLWNAIRNHQFFRPGYLTFTLNGSAGTDINGLIGIYYRSKAGEDFTFISDLAVTLAQSLVHTTGNMFASHSIRLEKRMLMSVMVQQWLKKDAPSKEPGDIGAPLYGSGIDLTEFAAGELIIMQITPPSSANGVQVFTVDVDCGFLMNGYQPEQQMPSTEDSAIIQMGIKDEEYNDGEGRRYDNAYFCYHHYKGFDDADSNTIVASGFWDRHTNPWMSDLLEVAGSVNDLVIQEPSANESGKGCREHKLGDLDVMMELAVFTPPLVVSYSKQYGSADPTVTQDTMHYALRCQSNGKDTGSPGSAPDIIILYNAQGFAQTMQWSDTGSTDARFKVDFPEYEGLVEVYTIDPFNNTAGTRGLYGMERIRASLTPANRKKRSTFFVHPSLRSHCQLTRVIPRPITARRSPPVLKLDIGSSRQSSWIDMPPGSLFESYMKKTEDHNAKTEEAIDGLTNIIGGLVPKLAKSMTSLANMFRAKWTQETCEVLDSEDEDEPCSSSKRSRLSETTQDPDSE